MINVLQAFNTDYSLMWEWVESKGFDVATSPTQATPSHRTFNIILHGKKTVNVNLMNTMYACTQHIDSITYCCDSAILTFFTPSLCRS